MKKRVVSFLSMLLLLITIPTFAMAEGYTYEFDAQGGGPHCKSLFMVNVDTGTVVYAMNPDERLPMASTTKVMSYIVAYENIPDIHNTVITVPETVETDLEGTYSSTAGVIVGEKLTGYELLNMMMIPSGNDAALTLSKYVDSLHITVGQKKAQEAAAAQAAAENSAGEHAENARQALDASAAGDAPGAEDDADDGRVLTFVDLMNRKAAELGCENTHFVNPHGLHDPEHYTTARDLMKIVEYAMTLPDFTEITSATYYTAPITNKRAEPQDVSTTNLMMLQNSGYYYPYTTGIKTGSLNESGYCIVASAVHNGYNYIVVALGSPYVDEDGNKIEFHGEMEDAAELFDWAFNNLQMSAIVENGKLMGDVALKYAWKKEKLQVVAAETINAILPANFSSSSVVAILDLPDSVEAPVRKGDVIGSATLTYADEVIGKVTLVAGESVDRSEMMKTLEQGKKIFTSGWFLAIMGIIGFLVVLYIILILITRKKSRQAKKVKRFRNM